MRIPDSVIEEVSRRIDIVELVGNYVTLKPSGSRYMGLCPFHTEKTPSFSVNPEMGAFYCFGCHKGGSAFNFVMEMEGMTFPEAVRHLAEQVGVEVSAEEDDDSSRRRKGLLELYTRVSRSFCYFLSETEQGKVAREILQSRAVSDANIDRFLVGYSPSDPYWLHGFLHQKNYSDDFLAGSGLFTRANTKRSLFAGRIMFPIRSQRGEVVAFGGRLMQGDGPKYINSPETEIFRKSATLYGLDLAQRAIRTARRVVIAEGYMDVLALHEAGVENAVAPLGTAMTDEHGRLLARYCESALLVFDGDEAGVRATSRAAGVLEGNGILCDVAPMEAGTDPADLLLNGGSRAVVDAISSPLTALEFLVRAGLNSASGGRTGSLSPESKAFVLRGVFPYISVMRSEVRRRESLRRLADLVGVDRDAVIRDYGREHRSTGTTGNAGRDLGPSVRTSDTRISHDLYLMLAAVARREHFAYVRNWIQPADLEDPVARELYVALEECFRRGEESLEMLLERVRDESAVEVVRRRMATGEFDGMNEQAVRDGVVSIRRRSLERKVRDVESRLRQLDSGGTGASEESDLLAEKMYLDRELLKLKGEVG